MELLSNFALLPCRTIVHFTNHRRNCAGGGASPMNRALCSLTDLLKMLLLLCAYSTATLTPTGDDGRPVLPGTSPVLSKLDGISKVMEMYNKEVPPKHRDIDLHVNVRYSNLLDIKNKDQIVISRFRLAMEYTDSRLAWKYNVTNESAFRLPEKHFRTSRKANEDAVIVDGALVWQPLIMMMNSAKIDTTAPETALIESNGRITLRKYWMAETTCNLNLGKFPADIQNCKLIFDVISYGVFLGHKPKTMALVQGEKAVKDVEYFVQNSEWEIREEEKLAKIVTDGKGNFAAVIDLVFRRRGSYYLRSLMMPGIVITIISFFGYLLPADGGHGKAGLGVTCLLSMAVFRLTLQDHLAPDEDGINIVQIYLDSISLNIAFIVISAILVVHIHCIGTGPAPPQPKLWMINAASWSARLLRMKADYQVLEQIKRTRTHVDHGCDAMEGTTEQNPDDNVVWETRQGTAWFHSKQGHHQAEGIGVGGRYAIKGTPDGIPPIPNSLINKSEPPLCITVRQTLENGRIVTEGVAVGELSKKPEPIGPSQAAPFHPSRAQHDVFQGLSVPEISREWKLVAQQVNSAMATTNLICFIIFNIKVLIDLAPEASAS